MNNKPRSERLMEAMATVMQHWEIRRKAEANQPDRGRLSSRAFTVAVSRESGARGTSTIDAER